MNDTSTPRPNVATGAFMGFFLMVLGLLLTALQTTPTTLEGWLVALQPVVAFVIAYPPQHVEFRVLVHNRGYRVFLAL